MKTLYIWKLIRKPGSMETIDMIIKSSTEFYIDLVYQLSDTVRHILILLLGKATRKHRIKIFLHRWYYILNYNKGVLTCRNIPTKILGN